MSASKCLTSTCRHCRFYTIEGRRGGHCQQLDVQVQGCWKACSLAAPPFQENWPMTIGHGALGMGHGA